MCCLDEYKEASVNWRPFGEARFKQLTVFLTATSGLGAALYTDVAKNDLGVRTFLLALGLILTAGFLVLEERTKSFRSRYMHFLRDDLETELQFRQYQETKNEFPLRGRYVYRFTLVFVAVIWMLLGVQVKVSTFWTQAWAVAFAVAMSVTISLGMDEFRKRKSATVGKKSPKLASPQTGIDQTATRQLVDNDNRVS